MRGVILLGGRRLRTVLLGSVGTVDAHPGAADDPADRAAVADGQHGARRRVRRPAPLLRNRLPSGRGATEQPNMTHEVAIYSARLPAT